MTRRLLETLRLSSLIALAPLLAAPRGCHFGSDEVPLGSNVDDNEAGAGVGSGGTGASPTTGGNGSANGGTAAQGGSGTTGGASGTGTGGSGTTTSSNGACLERLTEIPAGDETPLGFTELEVQELLAGRHRTMLATRNTAPTNVTLEFVGPIRVFFVESRPNPDFTLDIHFECNDHVRAKAFARFVSDDGVFDETFPELELNVGAITDSSANPVSTLHAGAGLTLERHELRGSYYPPIPDTQCLLGLQFNLTVTNDEFTGLLIEQLLSTPCGDDDPNAAVLISELGSWRCQGEACRLPANDSVVVEATSCDRFGPQVTSSSDDGTFNRIGDAIWREEFWGCGCAARAEHVMVYTPSSPVELRLCHDESADTCEAGCSQPVSYDLSRAFRAAGTREFRFVD